MRIELTVLINTLKCDNIAQTFHKTFNFNRMSKLTSREMKPKQRKDASPKKVETTIS